MTSLLLDPPAPTVASPPPLAGYQCRLPGFEGPLDVLLRLVERDQLPITDVSLVAVTDQFLAYLAELDDAPPETIAEFATVGTRLVLLKSRSLLPRPPSAEAAEADPGDLVRQLGEYRAIKLAAERLAHQDRLGAGAFARGGGVALPARAAFPPLAAHQAGSLTRAIRRRLALLAPPVHPLVARPVVTLREMIERTLARVAADGRARYRDLLAPGADRNEALTAFLAVLVLVRRRVVDAEQTELFGEITLRPVPPGAAPSRATNAATGDGLAAGD